MAYYFKLPTYDDLNAKQRGAIRHIGAVGLTGGPGTGKSVVSVYRHINNYKNERRSLLLTYSRALHFFLAQSVISFSNLEDDKVEKEKLKRAYYNVDKALSWHGENYDEIIVDEAQDLSLYPLVIKYEKLIHGKFSKWKEDSNTLERYNGNYLANSIIIRLNESEYTLNHWYTSSESRYMITYYERGNFSFFKRFSKNLSYGADNDQKLYSTSTTEESLKELNSTNRIFRLRKNFRNTYNILNFINHATDFNISPSVLEELKENTSRQGMVPILKITNKKSQNNAIIDIVESFNDGVTNIAVLVPFIKTVDYISHFFVNKGYIEKGEGLKSFSKYHRGTDVIRINNIHITTFKSVKGLEFDVVIIPDYESKDNWIRNVEVVDESDYYVALTRAKNNLFLISDKDLEMDKKVLEREHFDLKDTVENTNVKTIEDYELPF